MEKKQSYSNAIKQATVRLIHASPEWAEIQSDTRTRLSPGLMEQARAVSGGASNDSIRRWLTSDISEESEKHRLSLRGREAAHSEDFLSLAVGYAIHRRLELLPLSAQDIIDWARGFFNVNLRHQFVSELLTRHGLSSQLAMARNSRMVDPQVAEDCVAFILELRQARKFFRRLLVMDETGLWSNTIQRKTYHFRHQYEILIFPICTHFPQLRAM